MVFYAFLILLLPFYLEPFADEIKPNARWKKEKTFFAISDTICKWNDQITAAAFEWNKVPAKISIRKKIANGKIVHCVPSGFDTLDGENTICFDVLSDTPDGKDHGLAQTFPRYADDNSFIEVDIKINSDIDYAFENGTIDLKSLMIHEFGHFLGLPNLTLKRDSTSIMFHRYKGKKGITSDDKDALILKYGRAK